MKIDWKSIWESFDAWTESRDSETCKACGHISHDYPEWDEQMRKIERLVNAQIARKARSTTRRSSE